MTQSKFALVYVPGEYLSQAHLVDGYKDRPPPARLNERIQRDISVNRGRTPERYVLMEIVSRCVLPAPGFGTWVFE